MTNTPRNAFNNHAGNDNSNLPVWDLDKLFGYDGYGSESFEADYKKIEQMSEAFITKYKGRIKDLSGDELAQAMEDDSDIDHLVGKMVTYLSSYNTQDSNAHSHAYQTFIGRLTKTLRDMDFFGNELKNISKKKLNYTIQSSPALQKWEPALARLQDAKKHRMPEDVQRYASDMGAGGFLVQMFGEKQAMLRFNLEGKELNVTQITKIIAGDPNQARRATAQAEFERVMAEELWFNSKIHNGLIKFKSVGDSWSKFENPADSRHFSNNVTPAMVDALEKSVKDNYARTSHRFYSLKAKLMGQDHLNVYDRNVNVFEDQGSDKITWDQAKKIVLDAYYAFDKRAGDVAKKFFDEGWIDAAPGANKRGGAYASPGAAQLMHPLVMVNFQGTAGCVKTLAHELGHGIHQYMAANEGDAIVSTPLTLAETASVFGEMLTFTSLMDNAQNDEQRRKLLFDKVNDMLNTVVRQISFYDFEKRTHGQYQKTKAPLKPEDFKKHWNDVAKESLGPSVKIEDSYGPVFGYIPHIVNTPFYVYAYAFGDSLVNALWQVYEDGDVPEQEFKDKYFAMLEAGGTYKVEDLKRDFGLDVADPAFWQKGLNMMESMIDELEELCKPLLDQTCDQDMAPNTPDAGQL